MKTENLSLVDCFWLLHDFALVFLLLFIYCFPCFYRRLNKVGFKWLPGYEWRFLSQWWAACLWHWQKPVGPRPTHLLMEKSGQKWSHGRVTAKESPPTWNKDSLLSCAVNHRTHRWHTQWVQNWNIRLQKENMKVCRRWKIAESSGYISANLEMWFLFKLSWMLKMQADASPSQRCLKRPSSPVPPQSVCTQKNRCCLEVSSLQQIWI